MRTRSVGHACLEIETSGLRIVTDPWWTGPAYTNQWYAWPTPQPAGLDTRPIDYLYLSHGHEDHLHADTLRTLRPGATALIPEFLVGSFGSYLRDELGFCQIIELKHGRTVTLRRGLRVTCYVNVTDSILVIEDGDRVLIDANDALHASTPAVIDHLCRTIRRNHPHIDTLFIGFAGASWFPNCLRLPGKNDRHVARTREELFTDNFVRAVDELQPRVACAFAASFVLVEPHNRWINDIRFSLPTPDAVYQQRRPSSGIRTHLLLPNDVIDGIDIVQGTTPTPTAAELEKAFQGPLRAAAERAEQLSPLSPDALKDLVARLDTRVHANQERVARMQPFQLELRLRNNPGIALRIVADLSGVRAALGPPRAATASLELRAEVLDAALQSEYGTEAILIGYGAVASLKRPEDMRYIHGLFQLLTPRTASMRAVLGELQRHPVRTLTTAWRQRWPLAFTAGTRLGLLPHPYELRTLGTPAPAPPLREAA